MMRKKLNFRKRLYCSVVAILSLFAVCSNSVYAANNGSGGIPMDANDSQRSMQEPKVGTKAPDFKFTKDGKSVKLSDFEYYNIVLTFSASSPAENSRVNGDIARLTEQYKNADIVFINIPIDKYADVAKQYGVSSVPAVCIIKPDGSIVSIESGNVDLAKKLKDLFGM